VTGVSTIEVDEAGMSALREFARDRVGGRLAGQMVDDARRLAPKDTTALSLTGRVVRMGPELWRIVFGEGLPDGRAIYQEMGTDWLMPNGKVRIMAAQPYIRPSVYRERSL
jgi:hypothetical protein